MKNQCKICFNQFNISYLRQLIEGTSFICDNCLNQIDNNIITEIIDNTQITFLSSYSGLLKQMLLNYKEYHDFELRDCFLYLFLLYIKLHFHNYIFVPIPSSEIKYKERGFKHLQEILNVSKLKYVDALIKKDNQVQKELTLFERLKNNDFKLNNNINLENKKIAIFDDVYTSGSSFKHAKDELLKLHPKKIKGLIIMRNIYRIK